MASTTPASVNAISVTSEPTKDAIRAAAKDMFSVRGFGGTSVRDIAKVAGVNAALVIRYFGSKEGLFLETMSIDDGFSGLTDPPIADLGRTIVSRLIGGRNESAQLFYTALMRASDRPDVRARLMSATSKHIVEPLTARLPGPDARLRAALIAAQITGLLDQLWILEDSELSGMPQDDIVELYGWSIQALVDGR